MKKKTKKSVRKGVSGLGILVMLIFRQPPMPEFVLFRRNEIVATRCFSLKKIALDFHIN